MPLYAVQKKKRGKGKSNTNLHWWKNPTVRKGSLKAEKMLPINVQSK